MTRFNWLLVMLLGLTKVAHATLPAEPIAGRYLAEHKDHKIEIFLRERVLFGRIAWTRDTGLTDAKNNDPALRSRRVAGIEHLRGFVKSRDGTWVGGTLYNPEDGGTYEAKLRLEGESHLVIQGRPKVPVLGGILGALFGRIAYSREQKP